MRTCTLCILPQLHISTKRERWREGMGTDVRNRNCEDGDAPEDPRPNVAQFAQLGEEAGAQHDCRESEKRVSTQHSGCGGCQKANLCVKHALEPLGAH